MTDAPPPAPSPRPPALPPWARTAIDYIGPAALLVGWLVHRDILAATWWLVAGSALSLALTYALLKRVAPMPLLWGGAALVFGVLGLVFHDPRIVKMKTTVIDLALGAFLLGSLAWQRGAPGRRANPLSVMLGDAVHLTEAGWRRLTWSYGLFFLAMAVANEVIWRTQPDRVWVLFRFPGLPLLAVLFAFTQTPTLLKEQRSADPAPDTGDEAAARLTELQE